MPDNKSNLKFIQFDPTRVKSAEAFGKQKTLSLVEILPFFFFLTDSYFHTVRSSQKNSWATVYALLQNERKKIYFPILTSFLLIEASIKQINKFGL